MDNTSDKNKHEMRLMNSRPDGSCLYACLLCPCRIVARDKKEALEKSYLIECVKESEIINE